MPRELRASNGLTSTAISMDKSEAVRSTICSSSSWSYRSSRAVIPNREYSGADTRPVLVVAPINVKRGSEILMVRALGPSPMTTSTS